MSIVAVGGLKQTGKTKLIGALLTWGEVNFFESWAAFKPFDCDLSGHNREDIPTDAEFLSGKITKHPHPSLLNPYMSYLPAPFEYALNQDSITLDLKRVSQIFQQLKNAYRGIWIESFDIWCAPINKKLSWLDWLLCEAHCDCALWVISTAPAAFNMNLSQILTMRENFNKFAVVLNNHPLIKDEYWLQYCWKKLELTYQVPVLGIYQQPDLKAENDKSNDTLIKNIYEYYRSITSV